MSTDIGQDGPSNTAAAAIFVDPRSRLIDEQLHRFAPSDASILIVGETGTGKEVVARQIHERSHRNGPFIAVNCGALSESLSEAALFGHEAGAYTGAAGARAGWFETADKGTLFLDEVGDLPLTLQVALLRVLQERQVVRLGSRKIVPVDVRVVAATNVDLRKAVSEGKFRLDLCFRLAVVILELPPLRQRVADILPLAQRFIASYSARLNRTPPSLSVDARNAMLDYPWPGNIRELENAIHAAVLINVDGVIRSTDLKFVSWARNQPGKMTMALPAMASNGQFRHAPANGVTHQPDDVSVDDLTPYVDRLLGAPQEQLLENIEALMIQRAMIHSKGNQVHAARLLGITRNVLRTYLKRFGLMRV
jgi:sigma-54-specific transcriptional regulator